MPIIQVIFVAGHRVTTVLRVLKITWSPFYNWVNHVPNQREQENQMTQARAKEIWLSSDRGYGYKRIKIALHRQGINVGVRRLWQLLKEANCQSAMTKKYRKPVTEVLHAQGPNLIKQLDDQSGIWSADVTYIRVPSGQYMYLGTVYDPQSRKGLAHQLSSVRDGRFVSDILLEALSQYLKPAYLHRDRGSEYTSSVFENVLETIRIRHSYSKKGYLDNNVSLEAFHSTLKRELIYLNRFKSKFEIVARISRYIHRYNHERIHTYESSSAI